MSGVHSASPHTQPGAARSVLANDPPFTKKRCGKLSVWANELELAHAFAEREGLTFTLATADYQVAKLTGPDVRIVIYPHKTKGTGNVSLRVRDESSKNPDRADEIMGAMNALAPYCNTFSRHLSMAAWKRQKARTAASEGSVGTKADRPKSQNPQPNSRRQADD